MAQNILEKNYMTESFKSSASAKDCHCNNALEIVESIKRYIFENDCPTVSMDVSHLNIIDASKVTILCSTYHYAKYPHGEISWFINSSEVKNIIKPLNLGNARFITV